MLEWAIQSSQKVRFSYEERNGEKSDCTVSPIEFKTVEQTLCLEGYCHLRRAKRVFAIACMQDVRIVSASEANYRQVTSQELITPYINIQDKVNPTSQSLPSNVTQAKNTDAQVRQRPYIKCHIDELERIAASQWNDTKVLNEIHYELKFRSRKKALDLCKRIAARLDFLQKGRERWQK